MAGFLFGKKPLDKAAKQGGVVVEGKAHEKREEQSLDYIKGQIESMKKKVDAKKPASPKAVEVLKSKKGGY